jgi:hypothetical protein
LIATGSAGGAFAFDLECADARETGFRYFKYLDTSDAMVKHGNEKQVNSFD